MKASDIPEEVRAALDGRPAEPKTFTAWMGEQSAAEQDRLFGPAAAERWRAGEISQAEMIRQARRPLYPAEFASGAG